MDIQVYCAHSRMVDIEAMVENPRNPNKHSDKQISLLAKIIKSQGCGGQDSGDGGHGLMRY